MQVNELTGQVQKGSPPPHVEQAVGATRGTPDTRAKRPDADLSRRQANRPLARKPIRFGAGF